MFVIFLFFQAATSVRSRSKSDIRGIKMTFDGVS